MAPFGVGTPGRARGTQTGRRERTRHLQQRLPSNIAGAKKGPFVVVVVIVGVFVSERTLEITRKTQGRTDGRSQYPEEEGGRECASE